MTVVGNLAISQDAQKMIRRIGEDGRENEKRENGREKKSISVIPTATYTKSAEKYSLREK